MKLYNNTFTIVLTPIWVLSSPWYPWVLCELQKKEKSKYLACSYLGKSYYETDSLYHDYHKCGPSEAEHTIILVTQKELLFILRHLRTKETHDSLRVAPQDSRKLQMAESQLCVLCLHHYWGTRESNNSEPHMSSAIWLAGLTLWKALCFQGRREQSPSYPGHTP